MSVVVRFEGGWNDKRSSGWLESDLFGNSRGIGWRTDDLAGWNVCSGSVGRWSLGSNECVACCTGWNHVARPTAGESFGIPPTRTSWFRVTSPGATLTVLFVESGNSKRESAVDSNRSRVHKFNIVCGYSNIDCGSTTNGYLLSRVYGYKTSNVSIFGMQDSTMKMRVARGRYMSCK